MARELQRTFRALYQVNHVPCAFLGGVAVEAQGKARLHHGQGPAVIAAIPRPRLGYFGVLDERIDWELIAAVADRRPEWRWVLSSSVPDVVASYGQLVTSADGADAWTEMIERMLLAEPAALAARLALAQPVLEANTWDAIVARMAALMEAQLAA